MSIYAVMSDPTHEEYEERVQWLGGRFDPETFDPHKIKFDDPSQRWQLAFGQSVRPARQPRRRKRSPDDRRRASRARRNRP